MLPIICPRTGAGVDDHPAKAERAAAIASCTSSLVERGNSPNSSTSSAGLLLVKTDPSDAEVNCPLMILYPLTFGSPFGFSFSINSRPASRTCVMAGPTTRRK